VTVNLDAAGCVHKVTAVEDAMSTRPVVELATGSNFFSAGTFDGPMSSGPLAVPLDLTGPNHGRRMVGSDSGSVTTAAAAGPENQHTGSHSMQGQDPMLVHAVCKASGEFPVLARMPEK